MCIFPCKPYWGNTADDIEHDLSSEHAGYIGISKAITTTKQDGTIHIDKITEEAEATIQLLAGIWGDARTMPHILSITARKALAHLRQGRFDYEAMVLPMHENGTPPADINVYPDGGLTAPTNQHLGLPAAGIFIKNRFGQQEEEGDELEASEAQFDQRYKCQLDRCIRLPIPGLINSSTRSEAHGLLGGLCSKGPVHIGIDNKAVVDRACHLVGLALDLCQRRDDDVAMRTRVGLSFEIARKLRKPEAKHWQMQKDGDVWSAIWRVIIAKGPRAIKVTKVKGHATANDIEEGRATAATKAGNDVADGLVREATALHGKGTVELAYWLKPDRRLTAVLWLTYNNLSSACLPSTRKKEIGRKEKAIPSTASSFSKFWCPSDSPILAR